MVRLWPLAAGLVLLACLWLGPLPAMARRAFSPHMILHLGVMVVAAPLIVIGLMRLSPPDLAPRFQSLGAVAASVFDFAVVWGWHVPALHEVAARLDSAFALQQLSFLAAGLWLWWICLAGRDAGSGALGGFAMLFASMHMAMLGVLLVLAPALVYAPQFCLGAFGLDPLRDQQLGGGLMALFGALPYVAGGAYLASRLAAQEA
ncbi:cytochrome c oxidase assembly protein [Hoeflea sp. YIM 152468]|uniref:cytochrome c oxidase assembly protein n=1 Tax=Hoeflea sp. YIM 152468 TaxID=3031759 RepID=UPI0023DB078C|nr:cytochrome c oxidase assembly protein [Hoeflea sp. YIM 152468]